MSDVAALESKFESHSRAVNGQLSGVRNDIKELTKALRDLIRIDGEIKNIVTLVSRIGSEVDDHEGRVRVLEKSNVVNSIKIGTGERVYWMLGMVFFNVLTGIIVYVVTR